METHFIDFEAHEKYQEAVDTLISVFSDSYSYEEKVLFKRQLLELHELYNQI